MKDPVAVDPTKNSIDDEGEREIPDSGGGAGGWSALLLDRYEPSIRQSWCGGGTGTAETEGKMTAMLQALLLRDSDQQRRSTADEANDDPDHHHYHYDALPETVAARLRLLEHILEDLDRTTTSASTTDNDKDPQRLLTPDRIQLLTLVWRHHCASSLSSKARTTDKGAGCGSDEEEEQQTPNDVHKPDLHLRLRLLEGRCAAAVLAVVAHHPILLGGDSVGRRYQEVRHVQVGVVASRGYDNEEEEFATKETPTDRDACTYRISHLNLSFLDLDTPAGGSHPEIHIDDDNQADSDLRRAVDQYWHFWLEHQQSHRPSTTHAVSSDQSGAPSSSSTDLPSPISARTLVQLWANRGILSDLAQHARHRFFFGTTTMADDPGTLAIDNSVTGHNVTTTRLFLGKTVPYKRDPNPPPYLRAPSRVCVALRLATLLGAAARASQSGDLPPLPLDVWAALVPVADALLDEAPHEWNARGAALACDLLDAFEGNPVFETHPSTACVGAMDKWLERLRISADICRDGPALAVFGVAHARVLRARQRLASNAGAVKEEGKATVRLIQFQRREACRKWLTILYRNPIAPSNQPHLVLGLLLGTSHLLYDLVVYGLQSGEGVDVGRLGLSALLPLLSVDPDNPPDSGVQSDIQVAALVALHNLLLTAHPIVPRHAGKILCHLLAVCGSLASATASCVKQPGGQPLERILQLAIRVSAVAWALCQSSNNTNDLMTRICQPGQIYHESFVRVIRSVERESLHLMRVTSGGMPGVSTTESTLDLVEPRQQKNAVRSSGDNRTFIVAS